VLRKSFLLLCLLSFVAADQSTAQTVVPQAVPVNTWSARSNFGLTLLGTWTVVPDTMKGTATGTWTLVDAQMNTVTGGVWSASKSPAGWDGAWRAVIAGTTADHVGTWSSSINLKSDASFAELFEKALQTFVSGNWRYGRYSGTWTIRAFK
ncbi:MAG: hypothetical protein ABIW94_11165, partial [Gemmatimonadaceae bacterium]